MLTARIDVTKIDKTKLYKGEKGTYLDLVFIPTPDNKYGHDYMIAQSLPKEDRESGDRGAILGNGKYLRAKPEKKEEDFNPLHTDGKPEDDLPF